MHCDVFNGLIITGHLGYFEMFATVSKYREQLSAYHFLYFGLLFVLDFANWNGCVKGVNFLNTITNSPLLLYHLHTEHGELYLVPNFKFRYL